MNIRRKFIVGLLGLGLAVVASLTGCGQDITSSTSPNPPTPTEPKTEYAEIILTTPGGATVTNLRIKLKLGSEVKKDTLAATVTDQQVIRFNGLASGTYIVVTSKNGYQVQQTFFSIVDLQIPRASIVLKELTSDATQSVGTVTITDPNVQTPISVTAPSDMVDIAPGMAGASVMVSGSTGGVTVMTTGQSGVPAVTSGTSLVSSVMSAVQIQFDDVNSSTTANVTIPVPVDSSYYSALVGQSVDLLSYNFNTLTWESIGTATIGVGGVVTKTLTGTSELSETTLIAIGKQPQLATSTTALSTTSLSPTDLIDLKNQGVTTLTYDTNPSLSFDEATKPAGIRAAPFGIPPAVWGLLAPWIADKEPDLQSWVYDTGTIISYTIPLATDIRIDMIRRHTSFNFVYPWGNGVNIRYTVEIEFTLKEEVQIIVHVSTGGGGA